MKHSHEILIADAGVADLQILLDGLAPHVAVHLIQPGEDAIACIFDALSDPALRKLHLLAHGAPGGILFAGKEIRAADFLGRYDGAMQRDLDIAFWSCRTGAGEAGQAFVRAVAQATGARVAATGGLVGAADQDGSWDLGASVPAPFSATARSLFPHALVTGYLFYPEYPGGLGPIPDMLTSLQGILNAERQYNWSYEIWTVQLNDGYGGNPASDINGIIGLSETGYWSVVVDATRLTNVTGNAADMVTLLTAAHNNQITFSGTETLTVTGAVTVAQAAIIDAATTGVITLSTGVSDTIANLTGHTTVGEIYHVVDTVANLTAGLNGTIETNAADINILDTIANVQAGAGGTVETTAASSNIIDTAANVLANASDVAVTGATTITLVPGDTTLTNLSASDAVTLFDNLHTALNGNSYTVTDTAADLLAYGVDPALTGAASVTLAANDGTLAGISVASVLILFDNLHAGLNGNTYTIIDSAANLVGYWWDGNVQGAASITLAANDTTLAGISVGWAQALFDSLHAALNGNTYSIADTGAALLAAATDPAVTGAATVTLAAGDTTLTNLTAASAITLFDTLHAALNGNTYGITDTGAALLAAATDSAVTGATTITLAPGDTTVTNLAVASAITLFDTLHANLNGNTYSIADTAVHLLTNSTDAAVMGAAALDLSSNASLSLADAATLTGLANFSLNGHNLNLADSIANLTGNTGDYGATSYSVVDSAADILAASTGALVAGAAAVDLSANATLSVADATTLSSLNSFSTDGHTLNLTDSIADLTGHLSTAGASSHSIVDTAADILAAATASIVTTATSLGLSADASLTVANANTLTSLANFSLNGHALSLADSIANLTGNLATGGATGYSVVDSAENIAQFSSTNSTWAVSSLIHDGTAVTLTDAINPSELAAIEAIDPSGAVTIVPTNLSAPNTFMIADAATPSFTIAYGTVADVIAAPGAETIEIALGGKLKLTGTDGHDTIIFDGYQPGALVMTQSGTTAIFTDATTHAVVASISMDATFASQETIQYADGSQALVTLVGTPLTLHLATIHA